MGNYIDALAALVPAEVLALHAVILPATTKTSASVTEITAPGTLSWAFWGLIALSALLYVVPRLLNGKWDASDYIRLVIPPLAFVAWTMLQRSTAFDAVFPGLAEAPRTVAALFIAVILGFLASLMAKKADQKPKPGA